jgi:16S rRNA (guanine527-N7)-methyltransferase
MREHRSASANARIGRIQAADARLDQGSRARLSELARMIEGWPGLVSGPTDGLVADSLVLLDHLGDARRLVDVGSGGGLPGLALKIARPDLDMTLVEADQDKAAFLVQASARLHLEVEVVARRAEDAGHDERYRERFDVAVARALAPMRTLVELCLPFVKVGGRLLAQKTHAEDAGRAIEVLGGRLESVIPAPSRARSQGVVVVVRKVAPTPAAYPRRPGVPNRKPL